MLVSLPKISGGAYDVEKTTEVEGISFSDENLYRISDKATEPYYKPWNGYGTYQAPVEILLLTPMPTATMAP